MNPRKTPPRTLAVVLDAIASSPQPIRSLIVAERAWDRGMPELSVRDAHDALCALAATGMVRRVPPDRWEAGPYRLPITERMERIYARSLACRRAGRSPL